MASECWWRWVDEIFGFCVEIVPYRRAYWIFLFIVCIGFLIRVDLNGEIERAYNSLGFVHFNVMIELIEIRRCRSLFFKVYVMD